MDKLTEFFTGLNPTHLLIDTLALFVFALGGFCYGSHVTATADALAEAGRTAKAVQAQVDADAAVLARERTQHAADRKTFDDYRQEHADADAKTDHLVADLRADNRRLRIPVRAVCPAAPAAGGSVAEGAGQEGYADLTAGAGEFLVRLAARGDEAIRKHAAVVDLYNHLLATCTATPPREEEPNGHD